LATIAFFPEGAYGPTNNCAGIGAVLRARGHRVVFIVEESFAGTLEARGFEERLVRLSSPPETAEERAPGHIPSAPEERAPGHTPSAQEERAPGHIPSAQEERAPGQFWKDFVRDTAPVFRRPTLEQLELFIAPTFQALAEGARYTDERLREIIDELRPDVVVEDNVVFFPALAASGVPWVRIVSCNPAEVKDELVPPAFSGYPTEDRSGWSEYRQEYRRVIGPLAAEHDEFCRAHGAPPLAELELMAVSPWLNMYVYPRELDYERAAPPPGRWVALESCVRDEQEPWSPPEGEGPLVYLSLGSLGSADVELMQGLIDTLASESDLRIVVSLGPQHELLRLPKHMTGAEYLPQTAILPHADAVITHGGNNTVTESVHFGSPMVVLPIFWDQHDNAQRVQECGLGIRLDTYVHTPSELLEALRRQLADAALRARMAAISRRLRASPGTAKAAAQIERIATREDVPTAEITSPSSSTKILPSQSAR
jgi:MGT family glycosyltransferase